MLVIEEISNKTEEKPNKDLEVAKKVLQPSKKSLSWTPERKKEQALKMAKLIGSGKAYKGKKPKETEKTNDDKTDSSENTNSDISPRGGDPGVESELEPQEGVNPIVVFAIIFFAGLLAIFVFFKDEVVKIIQGEKHD